MNASGRALAVVVALLTALFVGCGDDGDRLTAVELSDQGNAICEDTRREVDAAFERVSADGEPTAVEMQQIARTAAESTQTAIDRFAALEPPEDVEDEWDDILDLARDAQGRLEEGSRTVEATQELFESEDPFEEINRRLAAVGVTACSETDDEKASGEVEEVVVTADEYAFGGIPEEVYPGLYRVTFENQGAELHELEAWRLRHGATTTELLEGLEDGGFEAAEAFVDGGVRGTHGPVEPGRSRVFEFEAVSGGTYVYVCLVEAADGTSNITRGMFGEFVTP
jgi:plastocyanin